MKKFLDEQGKLLGWINPVDLVIILVLVVLGLKILAVYRPEPLKFRENQVKVGLQILNIPAYVEQSIAVGQDLFDDRTGAYLGKIRSKRVKPAELMLENNGRLRVVQSPRNLDLRLELTRNGRIITGAAQSGVYLGKLVVRIGSQLRVHSRYTSFHGQVDALSVKP